MDRLISPRVDAELARTQPKIILLIGQRRVGKTHELRRLLAEHPDARFYDFEDFALRTLFEPTLATLDKLLGARDAQRLVLMDEIQYVSNIGSILKLIHDHFPRTRVVASGSAAFLMLRNIGDSLAGRGVIINVHPLLPREMSNDATNMRYVFGDYDGLIHKPFIDANLDEWLIHGCLPEVWQESDTARKEQLLRDYVNSLMLKDIFELEGIRLPDAMHKLTRMLALQIGSEVNVNELATALNLNRRTVLDYINILHKFRLIRILEAFSRNPRNEISRGFKVYFNDLGVRNALIGNFVPPSGRTDAGALFENFVSNLLAFNADAFQQPCDHYFWRNKSKAEIDLILVNQRTARLTAVEVKQSKSAKFPTAFAQDYKNDLDAFWVVQRQNLWQFI
jgi:predicted AAA+ superfamily ATPase